MRATGIWEGFCSNSSQFMALPFPFGEQRLFECDGGLDSRDDINCGESPLPAAAPEDSARGSARKTHKLTEAGLEEKGPAPGT